MNKKAIGLMLLGYWTVHGVTEASEGALTLTLENDTFTHSDNNYTNGVGIAWVSGAVDADDDGFLGRWTRLWSSLPFVADEGYMTYASWSLAQEMNTPDDIREPNPSADDQPYSGILYVDSTLYARKGDWTHAWQLKLGVVGPASQADEVQREFHQLIGADQPRGWDTQLPNEPVVNLGYTAAHLAAAGSVGGSAQWRLVPVATAGLGNYFTGAGLGVYGEVGWNLVEALGMTALRSGLNAASTVGVGPRNHWSVSFFTGAGAYGVIHYLPLDGTLFRDSRSVDSEPVVGMGSYGFSLRRDKFALSFSRTLFSESFETQRQDTDFGTVGISWLF
ncbi:lipid A deacylase LpxR family protein [Zobellella sp. An-6]|uniref:lipid A deacylase LpxR family protein n=1 Tax=Zobellella sp. An-6 TaxID=3400218 RepID=UPI004042C2BC